MVKFSKSQIQVIALLLIIAAGLAIGLIFRNRAMNPPPVAGGDIPADTTPDDTTPIIPHDKFRKARAADYSDSKQCKNIEWEINLGGSGDEEIIASFDLYGKIFVLGNTNSYDFDFEPDEGEYEAEKESGKVRAFMIEISADEGQIEAYHFYEGKLNLAFSFGDGITLVCDNGTSKDIFTVGLEGEILKSQTLVLESADEVETVIRSVDPSEIFIVAKSTNPLTSVISYKILTVQDDLTSPAYSSTFISEKTTSLSYVGAHYYDGNYYIAFTRASVSPYLMVYSWGGPGVSAGDFCSCIFEYSYSSYGFFPYADGFFTAIKSNSNSVNILKIKMEATYKIETLSLNIENAKDVTIFTAGGLNYVYSAINGGGGKMVYFDYENNGGEHSSFHYYSAVSACAAYTSVNSLQNYNCFGGQIVLSATEKKAALAFVKPGELREFALAGETETIKTILTYESKVIITATSSGTSPDVQNNFGGADVWLSSVKK